MARAEVKAALHALRPYPGFSSYVNTLERELADIMVKVILPQNRDLRDELCAEARVYRELLEDIHNNIGK